MNNSIYINKKDLYEEMNIIKNKYDLFYQFYDESIYNELIKDILNLINNFSKNVIIFINQNECKQRDELNFIRFILKKYSNLISDYIIINEIEISETYSNKLRNDFVDFLIDYHMKLFAIENNKISCNSHFNYKFDYNFTINIPSTKMGIEFFNKIIMDYNERINDKKITSIIFKYFINGGE